MNSDLLSAMRGSHEDYFGCIFPDREIEKLARVLWAMGKRNIL